MSIRYVLELTALACVLGVATNALAQSYPSKVIRMVSPFPAGGVNDTVGRIVADGLSSRLGQQVIVDNRPGAGGNIGTELVARAAPDGYTLLSGGMGSLVMNPLLAKVPYDPIKDFVPVIKLAQSPNVLCVHPSLPVKSVHELIALAKTRPGQLNYGSGGTGSNPHLSGALFTQMAGIDIVHVPYRGSILATTDLVAGQVHMAFLPMPVSLSHIENGKLRAIGITSKVRSPFLKETPTIDEQGLKGYDINPWYGILAPAGTAKSVINRLNAEINRVLQIPEVKAKLAAYGAEPVGGSPDAYATSLVEDIAKWRQVIARAGIKGD